MFLITRQEKLAIQKYKPHTVTLKIKSYLFKPIFFHYLIQQLPYTSRLVQIRSDILNEITSRSIKCVNILRHVSGRLDENKASLNEITKKPAKLRISRIQVFFN